MERAIKYKIFDVFLIVFFWYFVILILPREVPINILEVCCQKMQQTIFINSDKKLTFLYQY